MESLLDIILLESWRNNLLILSALGIAQSFAWRRLTIERRRPSLILSESLFLVFAIYLGPTLGNMINSLFENAGARNFLPSMTFAAPEGISENAGFALTVILAFILFLLYVVLWDLWQYWLHRLMHRPLPYKYLHAFHHNAVMSIMTSFRHSIPETAAVILLFNLPFSVLLNFTFPQVNMVVFWIAFTVLSLNLHNRIWIPFPTLGSVLMLPNHHLLHHAVHESYFHSNYGQIVTLWDRVFGTYVDPWSIPKETLLALRTGSQTTLSRDLLGFFGWSARVSSEDSETSSKI